MHKVAGCLWKSQSGDLGLTGASLRFQLLEVGEIATWGREGVCQKDSGQGLTHPGGRCHEVGDGGPPGRVVLRPPALCAQNMGAAGREKSILRIK